MFEITHDQEGIAMFMPTIYGPMPGQLTWEQTADLTRELIKLCRSVDVEIGWPKTPVPDSVKKAFKM